MDKDDKSRDSGRRRRQEQVDELFSSTAAHWRSVYEGGDLDARIYTQRGEVAERWVIGLSGGPRSVTLDLGCGAGLLSATLAGHGYSVQACDRTEVMVRQARAHVAELGLSSRVNVLVADAADLPWPDESVSVVVALGVIPWLHSPERALDEAARVLHPGGHVVVTSDNSLRLVFLLDPLLNPLIWPLRRLVARGLRRLGLRGAAPTSERTYTPRRLRRMLRRAQLRPLQETTVGFANFTLLSRPLLSERHGRALHERFQRLADRRVPLVRSLGSHVMVLAEKPRRVPRR